MQIHGWGRYPIIEAQIHAPLTVTGMREALRALKGRPAIAHGLGRSYGDSALCGDALSTRHLNHFLSFDSAQGMLACQGGVALSDILETFVPLGWFLPVTPGTEFVTVGGAIASDVHGKNHHKEGCFSEFVEQFTLLLAGGESVTCSRHENEALYRATCGGMGLTGVITQAVLRLKPVTSAFIEQTTLIARNLEDAFIQFERHGDSSYSVAWIDCMAKGEAMGRSVILLGEHAAQGGLSARARKEFAVPFTAPSWLLNPLSIGLFNQLYYSRARSKETRSRVHYESFFYPLDSLHHWNRLYGRKGFVQYQFVIPRAAGPEGMKAILRKIALSGYGSFLAVLKPLGPQNDNLLSFPMEGYSLGLDFKLQDGIPALLDELDAMVADYGGRVYLAKDARMSETAFKRFYPRWETFQQVRKDCGAPGSFASLQSRRLGLD